MFLKHAKLFAPVLNKGWPTKAKIVFHFIYVHNLQFDLGKLWTVFIMNYILCKILKKSYNNLIFTLWQEPMTSNGCFCNVFFTILFFTVILTRQLWRWDKGWATYSEKLLYFPVSFEDGIGAGGVKLHKPTEIIGSRFQIAASTFPPPPPPFNAHAWKRTKTWNKNYLHVHRYMNLILIDSSTKLSFCDICT
jgi:hypothetical protein